MKFTKSWLENRHLATEKPTEEILKTLTDIGLEVEDVQNAGAALQDFHIAEIVTATPHPDADRLKICMVNTGAGDLMQVVCGGPNARAGIKVVLAAPGMKIPSNGMKMKLSKIRGVESHGMLCSKVELGLGTEADGILELPDAAPVGERLIDFLALDDPLIEIGLTPNRGDCLGVRGIAQDLAAAGMGTLTPLDYAKHKGTFQSPIGITQDFSDANPDACPHFMGRYIRGVKNGPSPDFLKDHLASIGLESISTLVDITNFLTFDINRPLHVFDAKKLQGNITLRLADDGETLAAVDHKTYDLDQDMTVVADASGPIALGGIIGGMATGCTNETQDVFLEAAYFDPTRTAATGRKLGVITDARYRFERGVDPESAALGIDMATDLILQLCGGEASEIISCGAPLNNTYDITLPFALIPQYLGFDVPAAEVVQILERLGMKSLDKTADAVTVQTPTWRHDLTIPMDLVEEIGRIYGYQHIPELTLPTCRKAVPVITPVQVKISQLRHLLADTGFSEIVSWAMLSEKKFSAFGGNNTDLKLNNPISEALEWMRPSLLPNLLDALRHNQDRGQAMVNVFELGNQYKGLFPADHEMMAAAVRYGDKAPMHWAEKATPVSLYDIKADLFAALDLYGVSAKKVQIVTHDIPAWFHPGRSGVIQQGPKRRLGVFGEIHPKIAKMFGLKGRPVAFELFVDRMPKPKAAAKAIGGFDSSKYQKVERDFAFLMQRNVKASDVITAIEKVDPKLIVSVKIFDLYQGQGMDPDQKSISVRATLQPTDHTLTDAEIKGVYDAIVAAVNRHVGAELRE